MFEDTYKTITTLSEGLFKDRGSRFISFAIPVETEEEVKKHIADLKKKHHDACHHCYAYQLGYDKSVYRANDDGEPSGTAGKPIFGQIQSKDLTNILVVVVRYFGGTLLGVSGLINAYKTAAKEALESANILTKTVNDVYEITFDYLGMNDVMKIIKDYKLEIINQDFELTCLIEFSTRKNDSNIVYDKLSKVKDLKIKHLRVV
jgi:uncharacterized YigZ family protein